jgi:sialate O-acetylesterase
MKLNLFSCASLATVILLSADADRGWAQVNPKRPLLPSIFGDHMVLQQGQADPIWGWDAPGTKVTVIFSGQTNVTVAGADGKWMVKLAPLPASATPQVLTVSGTTTREVKDVLVGEVWLCSGQSNMQLPLWNPANNLRGDFNGDLEVLDSKLPELRLMRMPWVGSQELQDDFKGQWRVSSPENAGTFSAVGFLYGRYLQRILGVPVGLIDNSWGGSDAAAWVRRSAMENDPRFKELMARTVESETAYLSTNAQKDYEAELAKWQAAVKEAKAPGVNPPGEPFSPERWLSGQRRPGNLFNGVLHPIIGYGIKGVIWYQGEDNTKHYAEYVDLFPFLIEQWRKEWGQGDFPFYWVQLPNFGPVRPFPSDGSWAELREAQTKALKLPNTGQAVTIDLGEGNNIHPRDKHDVAARLVRWPLVKDYGMQLAFHSPEFKQLTVNSNKLIVEFDCFGSKLRPFGTYEVNGFAVCGQDKKWQWASGKVTGENTVEVWSEKVPSPIAVRYAWADNPVCNLYSNDGLPVTPFRTDDWK